MTNGAGTWRGRPIERRQQHSDGSAPEGRRPPATLEEGRCAVLLPAEPRRAPPTTARFSRAHANGAERSRARPNSATLPPPPSERCRASALAARPRRRRRPRGRRRPLAADRPRQRPARSRRGGSGRRSCAAQGEGRGVDAAPARLPPTLATGCRASVGTEHPAAPDSPAGAHRAQLRLLSAGGHLHCPGVIEYQQDRLLGKPTILNFCFSMGLAFEAALLSALV